MFYLFKVRRGKGRKKDGWMDGSSGKDALVPGTHTVEGDSIPSAVL